MPTGIEVYKVAVTTTGSAGSATGEAFTPAFSGYIEDIFLDFHASAPATTDTTISFDERGGNILAISNSITDALFAPRIKPVDNANTAITNAFDRFVVCGRVKVAVAQSDALTNAVIAWIKVTRV